MVNHAVVVKRVQRLTELKHHEVGRIHDVVYRTLAYCDDPVFQPLRGFTHRDTFDDCAQITRAQVGILNRYLSTVRYGRFGFGVGGVWKT